jgi:3',5'-nucleoside bisphosphate phosphatase
MEYPFEVDLHVHTTASDGDHTPTQIVMAAKEKGIRVVAISDHDNVGGIKEGIESGLQMGVEVVPAIEISVADEPEQDFMELHLLGYYINPDESRLKTTLDNVLSARIEQKRRTIRRLQELGFQVPEEDVFSLAKGGVPGKPHIFKIVQLYNSARIIGKQEFYDEYLNIGGKAYFSRSFDLSLKEAIQEIIANGGAPVLAHPGAYSKVKDVDDLVRRAVELGLLGIEINYTYNKNRPYEGKGISTIDLQGIIQHFEKLAYEFGLLKTGGSDFHGSYKSIKLGEMGMTYENYLKFKEGCVLARK